MLIQWWLEIRLKELDAVQSWIEETLKEKGKKSDAHSENCGRILKMRPNDPSGLSSMSIFEYLSKFKRNIDGTRADNTIRQGAASTVARNRATPRSANKILRKLTRSAADTGPESIEALEADLFEELASFIARRQTLIVSEFVEWRNDCVEGWKAILDENPENNVQSVMNRGVFSLDT